jgi:hypothetical protein
MSNVTKQDYLDAVAQKLVACKGLLSHGPVVDKDKKPIGNPFRDDIGVSVSFSNVLSIAENFYNARNGQDVVANYTQSAITNFSGGETYGDVSQVQTVGAIDVTIVLLTQSLIPYLAVDRSMNNPVDTIYYANIIADSTAGGVSAGDTVIGNFAPPNANVNLGPALYQQSITAGAVTTTETFNVNQYIVPGTVNIQLLRGGVSYTISDVKKDQILYCNGLAIPGTVNYTTGVIILTSGVAQGDVITVNALQDVGADSSGAQILKLRPQHTPVQLVSSPKQFIFNENEAANMYMNKMMAIASRAGGVTDYRALHFGRLTNAYIENINRDLLNALIKIGNAVNPILLNLGQYAVGGSFSMTKDDVITKFFIDMRSDLLSRTNTPASVCVTGTQGASLLQSVKDRWVAAPNFFTVQNGYVGTFDGMPVYRHNLLDVLQSAGNADFYMGCKLADNSSGTLVYGEYLPLVQTPTYGNVNNPIQRATGWYSQVGTQVIQSGLVAHGVVTLGSY